MPASTRVNRTDGLSVYRHDRQPPDPLGARMTDGPTVPDFSLAVRGYDRQQVEDYVLRLSQDLQDTHERALAAEQRQAASGPGSFDDLGLHVAGVLQHAAQEAERIREEARAEADAARQTLAHEEAAAGAHRDALLAEARGRADQLLRRVQAHADRQAEQTLRGLEDEAGALRREVADLHRTREEALRILGDLAARLGHVAGVPRITTGTTAGSGTGGPAWPGTTPPSVDLTATDEQPVIAHHTAGDDR